MSISAREQQALNSIKDGLAGSDPELATLLATFAEQASGEEMPARENIRMTPRWRVLRYVLVLWLLITAWLIAVALALSHGSGHVLCAEPAARNLLVMASNLRYNIRKTTFLPNGRGSCLRNRYPRTPGGTRISPGWTATR